MTKFNRYEILEELGKGGFGTVYKAEDQVLGRLVALKVLHPALVVDPSFVERFKQEARTAASFDFGNIVQIFDFGASKGQYYLSMAYMPGGSLRELLKREGKLSRERALRIFQDTAAGLSYAHNKNVIHRDLKPGNILLDEHGNARLSDLGFAKVLSNQSSLTMSMSGGLIGTPAYMAPELWNDQKSTKQTDQYSLACILVEMLTGIPLFDGESTPGIMNKHFQPLELPLETGDPWRDGLERALQQRPEDRWNTVDDFVKSIIQQEPRPISGEGKVDVHGQDEIPKVEDSDETSDEGIPEENIPIDEEYDAPTPPVQSSINGDNHSQVESTVLSSENDEPQAHVDEIDSQSESSEETTARDELADGGQPAQNQPESTSEPEDQPNPGEKQDPEETNIKGPESRKKKWGVAAFLILGGISIFGIILYINYVWRTYLPGESPQATETSGYTVYAQNDWTSTGMRIFAGDVIRIQYLDGYWSPWPGGYFSAEGDTSSSLYDPSNVIAGCHHAALIGTISFKEYFCVGTNDFSKKVENSGVLYLSINDTVRNDDSGSINLSITVNGIPAQ